MRNAHRSLIATAGLNTNFVCVAADFAAFFKGGA